jgi:SiaC family regulatory phosphoprotein
MSEFIVKASTKSPEINFNGSTGVLELSGRSMLEVSNEFFAPVIGWVDDYGKNPSKQTLVHARFDYFNTNASKSILDFFKRLELLHIAGKSTVLVKWFCAQDDEAMEEAGESYKTLLNIPFEIIPQ